MIIEKAGNNFTEYKKKLIGSWRCPYCDHNSILRDLDIFEASEKIENYADGKIDFTFISVVCPNNACKKMYAEFHLNLREPAYWREHPKESDFPVVGDWKLLPDSSAKSLPDYIPKAIRQDYEEACKIKNLSPKASATLSRRCLQTIIRDFYEIRDKDSLNNEIDSLNGQVDPDIILAFHNLRKIGNIGAHMQKDVNLIIDIDSGEAKKLIKFIEDIIELTYIARDKKQVNLKNIDNISQEKTKAKSRKD